MLEKEWGNASVFLVMDGVLQHSEFPRFKSYNMTRSIWRSPYTLNPNLKPLFLDTLMCNFIWKAGRDMMRGPDSSLDVACGHGTAINTLLLMLLLIFSYQYYYCCDYYESYTYYP